MQQASANQPEQGIGALARGLEAAQAAGSFLEEQGLEALHGGKFVVLDTAGAPVDFANGVLGLVGLEHPEPFLGSDYLRNRYADLLRSVGVDYRQPTGSPGENFGRNAAGFVSVGGGLKVLGKEFVQKFDEVIKRKKIDSRKIDLEEQNRALEDALEQTKGELFVERAKSANLSEKGASSSKVIKDSELPTFEELVTANPPQRRRYEEMIEEKPEQFEEIFARIRELNPQKKMALGGAVNNGSSRPRTKGAEPTIGGIFDISPPLHEMSPAPVFGYARA